jgi:hypothetical protein
MSPSQQSSLIGAHKVSEDAINDAVRRGSHARSRIRWRIDGSDSLLRGATLAVREMTLDGNSEIKAEDWLIVFEAGEA